MIDFSSQAKELLEIADNFRKKIVSKSETIIEHCYSADTAVVSGKIKGIINGTIPSDTAIELFTDSKIKRLIWMLQASHKRNYNTKEISEKTGLEDWKLRRYIASKKLKADSNKHSDGNPGRSGYSISKENLIDFIQQNTTEISNSKKMTDSFEQYISANINLIDNFLDRADPTIELGILELKLDKLNQIDESKILEKEILIQKLKIEKHYFERLRKNFEQNKPKLNAESSNELAYERWQKNFEQNKPKLNTESSNEKTSETN